MWFYHNPWEKEEPKNLANGTKDYHTLSDIKTYKTVVIKTMWYQHSVTNKPMEQNQEFRNRHMETCPLPQGENWLYSKWCLDNWLSI